MTTPVGGIGVKITADAAPAAAGIQDAMDKALSAMVANATQAFSRVEDAASHAGSSTGSSVDDGAAKAASSMDGIATEASSAFTRVEQAAAGAGSATGSSMDSGAGKAASSMDGIATAAASSFNRVEQSAAGAGSATDRSISTGAGRAASSMDGVASAAASSLSQVERDAADAGSSVGDSLAEGAAGASDSLDEVETSGRESLAGVEEAAEEAGKSVGDSVEKGSGKASRAFSFMGKAALATGAVVVAAVGGAIVKGFGRLTAIEDATAKLTGLGNSAEDVKSIMDNALNSVKGTAFGMDEAATTAAGAIAAGVKPGQDLERTLKLVGDAATIGGSSMADMGSIFNSVATSGKLQGDTLAQLSDQGIPIVAMLGKTLGKTGEEVVKLASDGKINFDMFREAMEAGLGGAALDSGKTTTGAFKNMGAAVSRFGATLIKGVFPLAKVALGGITSAVDSMSKAVEPALEGLSERLGQFATQLGPKLAPALTEAKGGVRAMGAAFREGGDDITSAGFAGAMERIGLMARSVFDSVKDNVGSVLPAFRDVSTALAPLLESFGGGLLVASFSTLRLAIEATGFALRVVGDFAREHGTAFRVLATTVLLGVAAYKAITLAMMVGKAAMVAYSAVVGIVKAAQYGAMVASYGNAGATYAMTGATNAQRVASVAAAAATRIWAGVQLAFNAVMTGNPIALVVVALVALVGAVTYAWKNFDWFREGVVTAWAWIKDAAVMAWEGYLQPILAKLGEVVTWLWNNVIKVYFTLMFEYWKLLADAAMWAWSNVLQPVIAFIGNAAVWLWTNAIQPAFSGIMAAWSWITDAATWAWSNVLQPVFGFIGTAATFLWQSVLSPAFSGIVSIWQTLWSAISWAWENVFSPVFGFIAAAGKVMAAIILTIVVGPMLLAWESLSRGASAMWAIIRPVFDNMGVFISWVWTTILQPMFNAFMATLKFLGDTFTLIWNNVIRPAWNALQVGLTAVYNAVLVPMFDAFMAVLRFLGDTFTFTWNNVIRPLWDALSRGLGVVYDSVLRPMFDAFMAVLGFLGGTFSAIWNNVIRPVWEALGAGMKRVYDSTIQPMFDGFHEALNFLQRAFDSVVEAIGSIWDKVKEIAAAPVRFVIDTVYNKGIKVAVNWVADKLGMDSLKLPDLKAEFARGGVTPGYTPGRDVHQYTSPTGGRLALSGGEAIMVPQWTKAVGGPGAVAAMNEAARTGNMARFAGGGVAGFAGGGTWQQLDAMRAEMFPGSVMTSGYRSSGGGYHQSGEAIDIGVAGDTQEGLMPIAAALMERFPAATQIIHNPNGSRSDGQNVDPSFWGADTWAQHANHVHWAMTQEALGGETGGGLLSSIGSLIGKAAGKVSEIAGLIAHPIDTIKKKFPDMFASFSALGDSPWVKAIANLPHKAMDGIVDKVKGWVGLGGSADPGGGGGAERWRDMAKKAISYVGLSPSDANVDAMVSQIGSESGGDPDIAQQITDVNGTGESAGVGLLQIIPGTWAANRDPALPDDRRDPFANMVGALRYYNGRYGPDLTQQWGQGHGYALGGIFNAYQAMAQGGIMDSLPRFAKGAIVNRPTVGVFGEAGPEALVPLGDAAARDDVLARAGLGGNTTRTINAPITIYAQDPVATGQAVSTALLRLSDGG